jgi:NAD(P)-dependent dehydrogenase (short-subunit alcohol dehydrogenase family)
MTTTNLEGRIAVVTGAGSGIGQASAVALARAGASVVVSDLNDDTARATASLIVGAGGRAVSSVADVSDPSNCERLISDAVAAYGGLHILHHSAGVALAGVDGITARIDPVDWDRILRINLSGTFYCCHFAIPAIEEAGGGSIINTASSMAHLPLGLMDAYAASKGGVAALTRSMALGCGARNIRVNAISPGYVDTPINASIFGDEALRDSFAAHHAMGLQTVEEIADLVVFLASDASRGITGSVLTCDRGWTAFKLPDAMPRPRPRRQQQP